MLSYYVKREKEETPVCKNTRRQHNMRLPPHVYAEFAKRKRKKEKGKKKKKKRRRRREKV
jgi:hypothetical protein